MVSDGTEITPITTWGTQELGSGRPDKPQRVSVRICAS